MNKIIDLLMSLSHNVDSLSLWGLYRPKRVRSQRS